MNEDIIYACAERMHSAYDYKPSGVAYEAATRDSALDRLLPRGGGDRVGGMA
jgi:hypothetical protein